ncbi:DUF479 domain-containing protein [Marinobacter halodurans]|uniref:DUF479 domain-containing protein n=1 Tax=Marinobacter halodurans TaxID=2528979 RepID=A0ABY1ZH65_9GAMM|nr:ACP phosphodiesterase [Marinobacter halodurans]TBW49520.1 DUF479 domain-containing protein [Marinobacter halodurans]
MNHLAHLFLAQPTTPSRVGNLLGDFARGVRTEALPAPVRQGLQNHWAVDAYTDRHPEVMASKALFSSRRRRFAGIALDVLYDHFLIRHWSRFATVDFDAFVTRAYADLEAGEHLMPASMATVVERMIRHDWFDAYRDLEQVGFALDRIAGRIRFANRFEGVIEEIWQHDSELEAHFLAFLPDLIAHVQARSLEQPAEPVPGEPWHWIR